MDVKSESDIEKTNYDAVWENLNQCLLLGSNETVPISLWHDKDMHCTECSLFMHCNLLCLLFT